MVLLIVLSNFGENQRTIIEINKIVITIELIIRITVTISQMSEKLNGIKVRFYCTLIDA